MEKIVSIFLCILFCCTLKAQGDSADQSNQGTDKKFALTAGLLQGGGSLPGADIEALIGQRIGIQLGAGYKGYGAGINYHIKPYINSSFLSLQYWHQGFGDTFVQEVIGVTYNLRLSRLFSAQLGLGAPTKTGPGVPDGYEVPPVMLMYSIGIYLPL